jgi:GNAT superfamily N-acetyltransferase
MTISFCIKSDYLTAMTDNLNRMIRLADEFFETKNDPSQLTITEEVMEQLRSIHPATMGETANDDGPVAWTIVIPVTRRSKELFLTDKIGETELVNRTLEEMTIDRHVVFSSVYLCSVLVLPEFRGKGLAKELLIGSISAIRKDHPIEDLFVWSFSAEGNGLAKNIAAAMDLPLLERNTG